MRAEGGSKRMEITLRRAVLALGLAIAAAPALAAQSGTRTSSFAYDSSGLLMQEVVEPDNAAFKLQTDTTYDAYGNKVAVTVSGSGITSRTSTTTFDGRGQFATGSANALGHAESVQVDARFGQPTSQTGPNGLTTSWQYDEFGRKTLEIRPDGTRTSWAYLYCSGVAGGTATCPANGAYVVVATPLAADGTTQNGPWVKEYRDALGRAIASDTQGFDASTVRQETRYDSFGRVSQSSRPYFLSGGVAQWTVRAYDALSRVISETQPNGKTRSFAYDGLKTTTTNELGRTRIVVRNAQGQIASATDALGNTTTFTYDPFGNLTAETDPVGNVSAATYDQRGRKVAINDPDLGAWTYAYDVLGQLVSQTDSKGQVTTFTYDVLGRPVNRFEPGLTSGWAYDTAAMGVGKLKAAGTNQGYWRDQTYDSLGRPAQVTLTVDGGNYTLSVTYDAQGRVATLRYPSGFTVAYAYTALGYLRQASDNATGQVLWTATARDAEGHLTGQAAGNGIATTQAFDPQTGRLTAIQAGANGAVENLTLTYDGRGNLLTRADAATGVSESFSYDPMSRLLTANVANGPAKSFSYDATGNLLTKSDVGSYSYPAAGQARPHAVQAVAGTLSSSFSYDGNGNLLSGLGRTLSWTAFNMPATIAQGATTLSFAYDSEHGRIKKTGPSGTTLYLNAFGALAERLAGAGGSVQFTEYVVAGGDTVALRTSRSDGSVTLRYLHKDHLGSLVALTDATGAVAERLSYDAWGKRRNTNGSDDPAGALTSQASRGFTGHEMLDDVDLVHMNGRVYDPITARFTSADPLTERKFGSQGWNRYSYVGNNPLVRTDPSGYCFMGCFWKPVLRSPVFRAAAAVAVSVVTYGAASPYVGAFWGSVAAGAAGGATSGALAGENANGIAKSAFIGGATAAAFYGVGSATGFHDNPNWDFATQNPDKFAANIAGHAIVGCASTAAQGGSCGSGALAAGFGAAASPAVASLPQELRLATITIVGGTASVLGGGKFENGAVTAAFGYLFSQAAGGGRSQSLGYQTVGGGPELTSWSVQWGLSEPSTAGGWVVQEIAGDLTVNGQTQSYRFWEAWPVSAGNQVTDLVRSGSPYDDIFRVDGKMTSGSVSLTATARFYEGSNLPPSFVPNNPSTFAGRLPSTTQNPNLPTSNATAPRVRTWSTQW